MPIFTKNTLPKAMELRDQLIRYIQERKPKDFNDVSIDLVNKITRSNAFKGEFSVDEIQKFVELPDSLAEAKEYFLLAFFVVAEGYHQTNHDKATKQFAFAAANELCLYYWRYGNNFYIRQHRDETHEDLVFAKRIYEQALIKAQYTENDYVMADTLRSLALIDLDMENYDAGRTKLIQAQKHTNAAIVYFKQHQWDITQLNKINGQITQLLALLN